MRTGLVSTLSMRLLIMTRWYYLKATSKSSISQRNDRCDIILQLLVLLREWVSQMERCCVTKVHARWGDRRMLRVRAIVSLPRWGNYVILVQTLDKLVCDRYASDTVRISVWNICIIKLWTDKLQKYFVWSDTCRVHCRISCRRRYFWSDTIRFTPDYPLTGFSSGLKNFHNFFY